MMMKDRSILELLEILNPERRGWIVVDHWEADLCAIGLAKPPELNRLVYVSTYNKPNGLYDYECEDSAGPTPGAYVTTQAGENVNLSTLIAILERHLDAVKHP